MSEEQRLAAIRTIVGRHLEHLLKEGWREVADRGDEAAAQQLNLAWSEIKADLMVQKVATRRSEILALFEEVLYRENRERYHDLVAYDEELLRPDDRPVDEPVDDARADLIRQAVRESVAPLAQRVDELAAAPWRFTGELDDAFRSIARLLQEKSIRGSAKVILETLTEALPGVPLPFLWDVLSYEDEWR